MDIIEKINHHLEDYTHSEKEIIKLILNNPEILQTATAKQLSEMAYTSASTVVRLCRKLGCKSYSEFKMNFIAQWEKKARATLYVDATIPFEKDDKIEDVLKQITELENIAIRETLSILNFDTYNRVIKMLIDADCIEVFGFGGNVKLLYDFAYKMRSIHKTVIINIDHQEQMLSAITKHKNHCAILISYSGETKHTLKYAKLLKENGTPSISITSLKNNSLTALTDEHLYVATMESKSYSNTKIGSFTSNISIFTLMNYLYTGVFLQDYDKNYQRLLNDQIVFNDR